MNENANLPSTTHVYKLKHSTLIYNIFSLVFSAIVFGLPLIMFVLMLVSILQTDTGDNSYKAFFVCIFTPLIVLLTINLILITISSFLSFSSRIEISPAGIVQKHSPYKHIRCKWSEVEKIGKLYLFTDILVLSSYEVIGLSISFWSPLRFLNNNLGSISLTGYEGWPEGQMAEDLKFYAPSLFINQPASPITMLEKDNLQAGAKFEISQESRLLAILSHASIFLSVGGLLVPLIIYATQMKKSPYVSLQALQALVWQFVAFVFNLLASTCMVASLMVPLITASLLSNGGLPGLSIEKIFLISILSGSILTIGNLAFVIYGVFGAIQVYQGKDFRYIFIGSRIEKFTR